MSRIIVDCFFQRRTTDPDPFYEEPNPGPVAYVILNDDGQIWKHTINAFVSFPTPDPVDFTDYWIVMTSQDGIEYLTGSYGDNNQLWSSGLIPANLPAGHYYIHVFFWYTCSTCPVGPSVNISLIANKKLEIQWSGSAFEPISKDNYHADIHYIKDASTDKYTVTWFKNGIRVTTGITSPTIQTIIRSTGSTLLTASAMTQIGSTGSYKRDETSSVIPTTDEGYLLIAQATIDGSTRNFSRIINFMSNSIVS